MADTRINRDGSREHKCQSCHTWKSVSEFDKTLSSSDDDYLVCSDCRDDDNAQDYLDRLAKTSDRVRDDFVFEEIQVPDGIAGQLRSDPRIDVVKVRKGEFGLDQGTMILDFKIRSQQESTRFRYDDMSTYSLEVDDAGTVLIKYWEASRRRTRIRTMHISEVFKRMGDPETDIRWVSPDDEVIE